MKTLKTWEMIRDIREGETYEVAAGQFEGCGVTYANYSNYASKVLVWDAPQYFKDVELFVAARGICEGYEWRKRTPAITVDFTKAFAAYEKGASIKPASWLEHNPPYMKANEGNHDFRAEDIRGKWIVEGDGEYWWE
ncbi:hypothetical protein [Paenibacillus planticolens]|uniref:Uncharacterized protein n=1 Tax=Paenibacillus planticolens TaxID=2654976 RepID=A0ABX1ZE87_9BACL|nr:hypothetical protein [Paenibacillus planticolens]NOU98421.1 hypothetical protein [Paenibacillus planticolens]